MMNQVAGRPVFLQEVAPRDGFQNERALIPTNEKIALIDALSATGVAAIEVTSFTSAQAIPALADAEAVMSGIRRQPGVTYTVLVPNVRGAERALRCAPDELNLVMSVSETHNLSNLRMFREQSFDALTQTIRLAHDAKLKTNVSLSCSFGCPMEGDISPEEVLRWTARFIDLGVQAFSLCDTTGMAFPTQVGDLVQTFRSRWPAVRLTLHFHNTRGLALANLHAALLMGADRFDAALGGLGGCPYAPGAAGNLCTEDAAHMLALIGCRTGIDFEALLNCAKRLPQLVGHDIPSHLAKAGHRANLHPAPRSLSEIRARALARAG